MLKKNLMDKIYKQKHFCENSIDKIAKANTYAAESAEVTQANQKGRTGELQENVTFCDDLIIMILEDNE